MSNGWAQEDVSSSPDQALSGIVTSSVITKEFRLSAGGASQGLAVKVKASAATIVGSITAKLQTALGNDWVDVKSVTVSAAGNFYIKVMSTVAGDAAIMPLLNKGRVVITTTNAGDSVTVASVEVLQAL